jgi:hypothetical protein
MTRGFEPSSFEIVGDGRCAMPMFWLGSDRKRGRESLGCTATWPSWRPRCRIADLLAALDTEAAGLIKIGRHRVSIPAVQPKIQVQHHPSFEQHDRERLRQPTFDYAFSVAKRVDPFSTSRYLVGRGGPSFLDLDSAYRAFFEGNYDMHAQSSMPSEVVKTRVVDERGMIGPIHVTATQLAVEVNGDELRGADLELFSPTTRHTIRLGGPQTLSFALPEGLPASNVWLWLKSRGTWLDYRSLAAPWATDEVLNQAGVQIDRPVEPQAIVEALVYAGEGPRVEFKGELPNQKTKSSNAFKTIVAFANGDGGTIVFGIDRDESTITGLHVDDLQVARGSLGQMIRSRVIPTPGFEITHHVVDSKDLLLLDVDSGMSPPYGLIVDPGSRDRPEYYVRRGASTYFAQPSDLAEAVRRRDR